MHWGFGSMGHGPWPIHFVLWFLILGLLIWGLVRLCGLRNRWQAVSSSERHQPYTDVPPVQPSALEVLRQRYARGDIDAATFDLMRERLEGSARPHD